MALASYFFCWSKRDWFWLVIALGFTLAADYYLILHNRHLPGVAIFCFAHVAYILRATAHKPEARPRRFYTGAGLVFVALAFIWLGGIYVAALLYAALFIFNIYVSARHIQRNRGLVMTGLLLFAACDICVLLSSLPMYFNAPIWLQQAYPMIWVFYLPSQALLAVSAVNLGRSYGPFSSDGGTSPSTTVFFTSPLVRQRPRR